MPLLSKEEQMVLEDALQVYMQISSRQMSPQQVQSVAAVARGILTKLQGAESGGNSNKPQGISDEWFENVCTGCDKLSPSGCSEKITAKFPGKCDPILVYERGRTKETDE